MGVSALFRQGKRWHKQIPIPIHQNPIMQLQGASTILLLPNPHPSIELHKNNRITFLGPKNQLANDGLSDAVLESIACPFPSSQVKCHDFVTFVISVMI
jgi:hypothetical protein